MNTLKEDIIYNEIRYGLIDINKYYNGDMDLSDIGLGVIDLIDYNINDFFKLISFAKELYPQVSKIIDNIIDTTFRDWFTPENHMKFKKDLNLYKNVVNINNGLLNN